MSNVIEPSSSESSRSGLAKVEVFRVTGRSYSNPTAVASPSDLTLEVIGSEPAAVILDDRCVSLYCLDPERRAALFVRTPADLDLYAAPFLYEAQRAQAEQVYAVPFELFHKLAGQVRERPQKFVSIYSPGRCGSTLLVRMLQGVRECFCLSEPDVYSQLCGEEFDDSERAALLQSATALLFKPDAGQTHLVVKHRFPTVQLAAEIHRQVADHVPVFLYRGAEPVVRSAMRNYCKPGSRGWLFDAACRLPVMRAIAKGPLGRRMASLHSPLQKRFPVTEMLPHGALGLYIFDWLAALDHAQQLIEDGQPVVPLHYDDLLQCPEEAFGELLGNCDLPPSQSGVARAVMESGDSQKGSVLSKSSQRQWEFGPRERAVLASLLKRHDTITDSEFRFSGTLPTGNS